MKNAMAAGPSNIDSTKTDLWSECWNQVVWGSQYDLDQAEAKSYKDQIAFCWDEYCQKMGKPEECVGDMGVATYQGKPPLPIQKDTEGDVAMTTPPSQTAAAPSTASTAPTPVHTAAKSSTKGHGGRGKPKGRS